LYLIAALGIGGFGLIVSASLAEHILGGAATVAVFTLMMDASDPDHAGSDYTLPACAVVTVQGLAGFAAGAVGDLLGYPALFGTSLVLSGIGCAALILSIDRGKGPSGVHAVWAKSVPIARRLPDRRRLANAGRPAPDALDLPTSGGDAYAARHAQPRGRVRWLRRPHRKSCQLNASRPELPQSLSQLRALFAGLPAGNTPVAGTYRAEFVGPGPLRFAAPRAIALGGMRRWHGKRFAGDGTAINVLHSPGDGAGLV